LRSLAESCSRQICGWANSLQNSDITGQRHLNDRTKTAYEQKRRSEAFMAQLDQTVRQNVAAWSAANEAMATKAQNNSSAIETSHEQE
jgi:hypothetical protein